VIAGLVLNCGGCGARLQVIADDKDAFAAQLENASRSAGRKIVALRNEDVDAWALLAGDDDTVLCPRPECRHRNMLITRTGTDRPELKIRDHTVRTSSRKEAD
jgi:hypothetical protein